MPAWRMLFPFACMALWTRGQDTPASPDTPEHAAARVAAAFEAKDDAAVKELAARDDPDPWLVADELLAAGRYDAALAFARAGRRGDTEALPGHLGSAPRPDDAAVRGALAAFQDAAAREDMAAALRAVEGVAVPKGTAAGVRVLYGRAAALQALGRRDEGLRAYLAAAESAQSIGWRDREARARAEAAGLAANSGDHETALSCWERCLAIEQARGNRRREARFLVSLGYALRHLGRYEQAVERLEAALSLARELGDRPVLADAHLNLGSAVSAVGDSERALQHHEEALRLYEELGDRQGLAYAYANIGSEHHRLGDPQKALAFQMKALSLKEELGDRPAMARTLGNLGNIHSGLGDENKAIELYERALAMHRESGNRYDLAIVLGNLGASHLTLGHGPQARAYLEEALALSDALGDREGVARHLGNIGNVHLSCGEYTEALRLFERALEAMDAIGNPGGVAHALSRIALVPARVGEYARALDLHRRALAIDEGLGRRAQVAESLRDIGAMHWRLGEHAKALDSLSRALALGEEIRNPALVATVLLGVGNVHAALEDHRRALEADERVMRVAEEVRDDRMIAHALNNIGLCWEALDDLDRALAFQERSLVIWRRREDPASIAQILTNVAIVRWRRGEAAEALGLLGEALVLERRLGNRAGEAEVLANFAHIRASRQEWDEAEEHHRRALALAEETGLAHVAIASLWGLAHTRFFRGDMDGTIASARDAIARMPEIVGGVGDEQGARARAQWAPVFEYGVQAAWRKNDAAALCHFIESGRAGALLEALAGGIRSAIPDALAAEEAMARREEAAARARLLSAADVEERRAARDRLGRARARTREVVERIQREAKAAANVIYPEPDALAAIQARLAPEEALVLYALTWDAALALLVGRDQARIVHLGDTKEIAAACAATTFDDPGTDPAADIVRLKALLVEPLEVPKTARRLLLCPDGPLAYVPFASLTDLEVAFVPSATSYGVLLGGAPARGRRVLAVGDPKTEDPPLPGARAEAMQLGDRVLVGAAASETALRAALHEEPCWRAVHLACHGNVDSRAPLCSWLSLAADESNDGSLSLQDVLVMKTPADLVILSACETAKGRVYKAEGVVGLVRVFMVAGASRVVVSLWEVDDEATNVLMARFYELWNPKAGSTGLPAATALRNAMEFVRDHPDHPGWDHPKYWAAWQLWGLPQ